MDFFELKFNIWIIVSKSFPSSVLNSEKKYFLGVKIFLTSFACIFNHSVSTTFLALAIIVQIGHKATATHNLTVKWRWKWIRKTFKGKLNFPIFTSWWSIYCSINLGSWFRWLSWLGIFRLACPVIAFFFCIFAGLSSYTNVKKWSK